MAESLHPSRLVFLAPLQQEAIRGVVVDLAAAGGAGEAVVLYDHLYAAVFAMVARLCFGDGVDESHVRAIQGAIHCFVLAIGEANTVFDGSTLAKLVHWRRLRDLFVFLGRQTELFLPLIAVRRKSGSGSRLCDGRVVPYVETLLDLRVPNDVAGGGKDSRRSLRDDEMVSLVSEFLGAGTGSTVACVEWTVAHLVTQPEVQNRLRHEVDGEAREGKSLRSMPYLHTVVLESLHMHPPLPFLLRGVHDHAEGTGAAAARDGTITQFILGDIGRDDKTWTDPGEFRPERFLAGGEAEDVGPLPGPKEIRMMPFRTGRRYCPGMGLGMLNVKCFLAALVREFEWAAVAEDCSGGGVDLTELDGMFKVMKKPLRARLTGRDTLTQECTLLVTTWP